MGLHGLWFTRDNGIKTIIHCNQVSCKHTEWESELLRDLHEFLLNCVAHTNYVHSSVFIWILRSVWGRFWAANNSPAQIIQHFVKRKRAGAWWLYKQNSSKRMWRRSWGWGGHKKCKSSKVEKTWRRQSSVQTESKVWLPATGKLWGAEPSWPGFCLTCRLMICWLFPTCALLKTPKSPYIVFNLISFVDFCWNIISFSLWRTCRFKTVWILLQVP